MHRLYTQVTGFFTVKKLFFSFTRSHFSGFGLISLATEPVFRKSLTMLHFEVFPLFCFQVLFLNLMSFVKVFHSLRTFVQHKRWRFNFLLLHAITKFFQYHLRQRLCFPVWLCQNSVGYNCGFLSESSITSIFICVFTLSFCFKNMILKV